MYEVATTLTDYLLAVIALLLSYRIRRASRAPLSQDTQIFFLGFAAAALLGGSVHGFFPDESTTAHRVLWWLTQLGTGIAALGLSLIGTRLLRLPSSVSKVIMPLLLLVYAAYAWQHTSFLSSVMASGFGTVICIAGLLRHSVRVRSHAAQLAIAGLVASVLAAVLQQQGLALPALGFDHNTVYHLFLMPSVWLFYVGMRGLVNDHE